MAINSSEIVTRFHSSGLTQKAFCATESISVSALQYHLKKIKRAQPESQPKAPSFISLSAQNDCSASRSVVVVRGRFGVSEICSILQFLEP